MLGALAQFVLGLAIVIAGAAVIFFGAPAPLPLLLKVGVWVAGPLLIGIGGGIVFTLVRPHTPQ